MPGRRPEQGPKWLIEPMLEGLGREASGTFHAWNPSGLVMRLGAIGHGWVIVTPEQGVKGRARTS